MFKEDRVQAVKATIQIKENSRLAAIAAFKLRTGRVAMVIGNTIHLHNTTSKEFFADQRWVCHELAHVQQWRTYGFFGFLTRYLVESFRHGYFNNKFEIEARNNESNTSLLSNFTIR